MTSPHLLSFHASPSYIFHPQCGVPLSGLAVNKVLGLPFPILSSFAINCFSIYHHISSHILYVTFISFFFGPYPTFHMHWNSKLYYSEGLRAFMQNSTDQTANVKTKTGIFTIFTTEVMPVALYLRRYVLNFRRDGQNPSFQDRSVQYSEERGNNILGTVDIYVPIYDAQHHKKPHDSSKKK